jgi:hypothetical protein
MHCYLIVGHGSKGLELPRIFLESEEETLPVFSSEEAAREVLSQSSLGEGWHVREFSGGELVSVLFAFHTGMKGVLLDPHPEALRGDVAVTPVPREDFVSSLLEDSAHHPAVGLRSQPRAETDTPPSG